MTSLGWVSMIGVASPKQLSRPALSLDALRRIPVPKLDATNRYALAQAFDTTLNHRLLALRDAESDEIRRVLDNSVADALAIDREVLDTRAQRDSRRAFCHGLA